MSPAEFASIVSMGDAAVGDVVNCPMLVAIKVDPPLARVEGIPVTSNVVPADVVVLVADVVVRLKHEETVSISSGRSRASLTSCWSSKLYYLT